MASSNEMETDPLQISSTSASDEAAAAAAQAPDVSFGLSVVTATKQSSGSESSPRSVSRVASEGRVVAASSSNRPSRASSPYYRNRAAPKPKHMYSCEVAKSKMPAPSGNPVTYGPTPEVHLHKHQQLGVIVQGVDPQVHSQALAQAQIVESQAVAYASEVQQQAQDHVQALALNMNNQAQTRVQAIEQQAQAMVSEVSVEASRQLAVANETIANLKQQNDMLARQQQELYSQIATLQSMVAEVKAGAVSTSVPQIPQSQNGAEITAALKAMASHVGQTMNELKDAVLSSSAQNSPKAKGRREPRRDSDHSASSVPGNRAARAPYFSSPPPPAYACGRLTTSSSHANASPVFTMPFFSLSQPVGQASSKSVGIGSGFASAAAPIAGAPGPPPPPGPEFFDIGDQEEGEEEQVDDDPIVEPRVGQDVGVGVQPPDGNGEGDYESATYKFKDLKDLKFPQLPKDSVGFRSWRNSLLTQYAAIDRTGQARILRWLQVCIRPEVTNREISRLQNDPEQLPRLDSFLASQISDAKYMKGEFGLEVQAYIERAHAHGVSPSGRAMIAMLSRRFRVDRVRGVTVTQQTLLAVTLDGFSYNQMQTFKERVEYILNGIAPEHWPSDATLFSWFYAKIKSSRGMQRIIDKVKDSSPTSRRRTFGWLWEQFSDHLAELREDANERDFKEAMLKETEGKGNRPPAKPKGHEAYAKTKANATAVPAKDATVPAAPGKPPKGTQKGGNKPKGQPSGAKSPGKGSPKGDKPKGGKGAKGTSNPPPPKASPNATPKENAAPAAKEKAPCLFYPKGTCNRGPNCPFAHVGSGNTASKAGAAAKATVAATVASVLPTSTNGSPANESPHRHTNTRSPLCSVKNIFDRVLRWFMGLSIVATPATIPSVDIALPIAQSGPFQLEWIADSGAGRNLTSFKALAQQGVGSGVGIAATQTDPVRFATGNGTFTASEVVRTIGSKFGRSESYLMNDCPMVRSMGELVNNHGHPFIWLPGSLPFFLPDSSSVASDAYGNIQLCSKDAIYASRLDGHVPIFQETIEFTDYAVPASSSAAGPTEDSPDGGSPKPPEVEPGEAHADSEREEEIPAAKTARLIKDAASREHRLAHFPKNPACKICTQARMYARKINKLRPDPLHDRGSLEPTTAFGERVAADIVVVFKESSKDDRDSTLLVVRDEFSGFIRSFPLARRTTENVVRALLQFSGKHADSKPVVMFKSDNAKELESACQQVSWVAEPTLANRWPHNSVLERDIRSIQEVTRAVHLQAGFAIRSGLWVHSSVFATFVLNLKHSIADRKESRYVAATGEEFPGRHLLLGQLVYYRTDPKSREKFEPSASPALFCGYRLDSGPESFRGVYLVLDYRKVKAGTAGYDLAISVPFEELFVPEGEEVFPMRAAFERALEGFTEPKFPDIKGLEVPFSPLSPDSAPAKRHEYITLDRIIKYGITPGCRACKGESIVHSPVCKVRFDGLVRADKTAEARIKSLPPTPVSIPPTPVPPPAELAPETADGDHGPPAEDSDIDDGYGIGGLINQELFVPDGGFVTRDRQIRRSKASGNNQLVEYCCSDDSEIGLAGVAYGVDCLKIGLSSLDFADPEHVDQAKGQIKQGAVIWMSMSCLEQAAQQHPKVHQHRASKKVQLRKGQAKARQMLKLAISLAEEKLSEGCHIAVDCPQGGWLWDEPEWISFETRANLKRVALHEQSSGKSLCISTTSLRTLQLFGQHQFSESDPQSVSREGSVCSVSDYSTQAAQLIVEAFFPEHFYRHIPSLLSSNALVTRNLAKSEWLKDARGLEAVQAEGIGLRSNQTWSDDSVKLLWQLKQECRASGRKVQIAELLTLCGVKHFELHPTQHKYKGRVVFRGDQVRDASGNLVLFGSEETATTPTGLVGLAACLFYGLRPGHATSVADAIQAYLQAKIGKETWVIIPRELWLPEWSQRFAADSRLVVKLEKSLYGHPESGKRWQDHLTVQLKKLGGRELPAYPSTWIFNIGSQKLVLNVYVDDLTLSGPVELHSQFWHRLRALVKLEPEVFVQSGSNGCRILGRHHSFTRDDSVATCEFDMIAYTQQLIEFYCEVTGIDKSKLRKVASPAFPESQATDSELNSTGELHGSASRILMRALWLSRLARPDISFIITRLASKVSRWDRFDDRQLLRCISYLHHSSHTTLKGSVSQRDLGCQIEVFTDADFASCPHSAKSTSGIIITLRTGESHFPVYWLSKKQSSTARSTTEAEMIALATAMFSETENLQAYLEDLLDTEVPVFFQQDNETVLAILKAGYSAKLRHMNRVHRVNVASVCERLAEERVKAIYCSTKLQRANGFTKVISPQEWPETLEQLCLSEGPARTSVPAAPSQNEVPADPLAELDPESVAGILPHRLTEAHILQLFHLLPADASSRPVVSSEGKGFTTGAYAHGGGITGLRSNTSKFRGVTRVLTRFVRQQAKKLTFSAVAIYQGCQFDLHTDKFNDPGSYNFVYPLTRIKGGQIWVEDPLGEQQCPQHNCNSPGLIHELPALFQPSKRHCTVPWKGPLQSRVVLVAFTPRAPAELRASELQLLDELGFRVPRRTRIL